MRVLVARSPDVRFPVWHLYGRWKWWAYAVGHPQILRLKLNRCKWPIWKRKRKRGEGKKKKEKAAFIRSFLSLIVTICRNFPLVNNRIMENASFFDPVRIPSKLRNLFSSILSLYLPSCWIYVIADIRRSCMLNHSAMCRIRTRWFCSRRR